MNLFQSKKNLLLLVSSVIVWLGTCLLAMRWNTVYDGAIGGFPTYLWVFAPVALIFNIFMNSRPSNLGTGAARLSGGADAVYCPAVRHEPAV